MTVYRRELKTLDNKTGRRIVREIRDIIENHEKYKKCYFWTQTGNAADRRRQEFTIELEFTLGGVRYGVFQVLTVSCKNFYYSCRVLKDGKRSNITALKKLIG